MRVRGIAAVVLTSAFLALPQAAEAQFSPRGIFGAVTSPFRHFLGRLPHFRRHYAAPSRAIANAPAPAKPAAAAADTHLSQLGPAAWPAVYADLVGYVFWPNDYARSVKDRGFDLIAQTITGPFKPVERRVATTQGETSGCNAAAADSDWPAAQVEKTANLSQVQQDALHKLQLQFRQATKSRQVDCADPNDVAAPQRLDHLIQALWSVRDTGLSLREPLSDFDETLTTAEQKAFAAQQKAPAPQTTGSAEGETNKAMQACAAQNVGAAERMIRELEQRVHPTKEQSANLEKLHKVSTDMAKMLTASCAQPVPNDPLARLDATDEQLTAMNYAATTVQIAFADFYNGLDDQQKARLKAAAH